MSVRPRVLIASPDPTELAQLSDWLTAEGIEPVPIRTLGAAIDEAESRPFDVLVADARFAFEGRLQAVARTRNPRAPLVVIGGADAALLDRLGAYHVERPVDRVLLLCIVTMAILEGRPARRSPRKRIPRFDAVVDGAPGFVIDVSNEGLRCEYPRTFAPSPQFGIRIPLVGIALTVRRVWVAAPGNERAAGAWCGVELFEPRRRAEENWRAFVSTVPSA
jgi:CheY-like chemotaxis protein